jgi:hypothetical protein
MIESYVHCAPSKGTSFAALGGTAQRCHGKIHKDMVVEIHTEAALQALIGESESIELEFKGPDDFLSWPQSKQNITKDLSKEVSAFANIYGGQIVIGIRETRDLPRRAEALEGVNPRQPPIETIQRIIETNIRPRLEGIRYQAIPLSGTNAGRVAYVITVPQGKTVHQAPDKLYYGRSEYESVPLEDQLIRYKMVRERVAEATINVVDVAWGTTHEEYDENPNASKKTEPLALPRTTDSYSFGLCIKNTGPITIRDCLLELRVEGLFTNIFGMPIKEMQEPRFFPLVNRQNQVEEHDSAIDAGVSQRSRAVVADKLFPGQEQPFPGATLTLDISRESIETAALIWRLYLEDSPPISGSIQLRDAISAKQVEVLKTLDASLEELRRIARSHPENAILRKQLAEALFQALNFVRRSGTLERRKALLGELRQLGQIYGQDEAIKQILGLAGSE